MGIQTGGIKEFFAKNYRYFIVGGLFVILVVLLIVFALKNKDKKSESDDAAAAVEAVEESGIEVPTDNYEVDAYPAVNTLLENYCDAMAAGDADTMATLCNSMTEEERKRIQVTAKYYDGFQNYVIYTKAGPIENSYLAIVGYDIKFKDIETLAPALASLYVCTDETGALYVNKDTPDAEAEAYFKALSVQDDIVDLLNTVETKYAEALASDEALKTYTAGLKEKINAEVKDELAAAAAAAAAPVEEAVSENEAPATTTYKATDKVNIRKSASTEADSLGKAEIGDTFTVLEELENGWSCVSYNDDKAYIKTEFLVPVEETPSDAAGEEGEATGEEAEGGEDETPATTSTTSGKVTVKETVNIRESASETGNKLGVAYRGEQFDLIEKENDWCKINYKGKTAYVKADFVE